MSLFLPASICAGSPVKTVFTAPGSEVMTIVRSSERRRVKYSP